LEQTDLLHFEACYYQGIEFAITHKLKVFNPGTQGEHKISRGFKPTLTYSFHHLSLEPFHDAVKQFCREEKHHNKLYMKECQQRLPFKTQE
jgi:predicted N-acyltransferase